MALVADMAQIWNCGSGAGRGLQLRLDPLPWEPPYAVGTALEKTKKNKKNKKTILISYLSSHTHKEAISDYLPKTVKKTKK